MKIGYKALSVVKDSLMSWSYWLSGAKIYYPDRPNNRKTGFGPLTCFDSLEHAKIFVVNNSYEYEWRPNKRIFKVEYVESTDKYLWYPTESELIKSLLTLTLPEGTVFADQITLLEEIPLET